ncbi:hypothetical protein HNQ82_001223 [Anoxybacillus tengchongensis]|uniref:YqaI-like protein n=1 Tax=Anoxybacillus tengchongensis TaxID=576944 RepID=A0A7W9YQE6_9BACL|nr:hypothetical protein [Anoxybacillus tengchongensis]MBB6176409.1 hypothetical protein [Anoxybacillus tengchongensis]
MRDLEHPAITRTLQTGYPHQIESEHWGVDACGDEILYGDTIYEFPDGEIVLEENIHEYLIHVLGATRKIAE